jgi:hypothetical protein
MYSRIHKPATKADFVRRFFDEGQTTIVVNLKGYNLDNALFDTVEVPDLAVEDPYVEEV